MNLADTQCCAILEIDGLSDHASPKEAMADLCFELCTYDDYWEEDKKELKIPGLITFSGVVGYEKGVTHMGSVTYGPAFASYIRKHNLGALAASPLTTNRLNHPGRQIRAWMWRPNVKNLKSWWAQNKD